MNAKTRNDKQTHHRRGSTNDRRVTVQPDRRHRSIRIGNERKFAVVIHHHPKCKHKSLRIYDGITCYIVVGAPFANHDCQTSSGYHLYVASEVRRDCVFPGQPARQESPSRTAQGPANRASDKIRRLAEHLAGSSASTREEKSCILVAARVLKRLRLQAKVTPPNLRTC
jgi:hypothetical protein